MGVPSEEVDMEEETGDCRGKSMKCAMMSRRRVDNCEARDVGDKEERMSGSGMMTWDLRTIERR